MLSFKLALPVRRIGSIAGASPVPASRVPAVRAEPKKLRRLSSNMGSASRMDWGISEIVCDGARERKWRNGFNDGRTKSIDKNLALMDEKSGFSLCPRFFLSE